ncbi:MAG TPA: hypothetical protein VJ951_01375 [Bacteroidales bacterium]|nr:hypothetical protein [Bacteroidales bacterium]
MRKKDKLEITEIFMAKTGKGNAGFDRCFYGTIKRGHDINGNPVVYGKIKVNDGYIYATASSQWELGEKLDEMVLLILNYDLHNMSSTNSWNDITVFSSN